MKRTILLTLLAVMLLPGCADVAAVKEQVTMLETALQQAHLQLRDARAYQDELRIELAALPDGDEKDKALEGVAKADKVVAKLDEHVGKLDARVASVQERLATVEDTPGLIDATARETAPLLPPPWGTYLLLGGTTVAAIIRARQNRATGRKLVSSLEGVLTDEQKAGLAGTQDTATKRLVKEGQGKALSVL